MSTDPIISERNELRKAALIARAKIPENIRDAYSQLIRKKVILLIDSLSVKSVHTYIGFNSEVGTKNLIKDLLDREIKVLVPVIIGEQMLHSAVKNVTDLIPGNFGVPVPKDIDEVSPKEVEVVIIPIVAFDGFGMRLGYGKGFYDRFLSSLPIEVKRIGLAFSVQEVDKIPKFSHDELINNIFTEQSDFFFDL